MSATITPVCFLLYPVWPIQVCVQGAVKWLCRGQWTWSRSKGTVSLCLATEMSDRNQKLLTLMKCPPSLLIWSVCIHTHKNSGFTNMSVLKKCSSLWFRISWGFLTPNDSHLNCDVFISCHQNSNLRKSSNLSDGDGSSCSWLCTLNMMVLMSVFLLWFVLFVF